MCPYLHTLKVPISRVINRTTATHDQQRNGSAKDVGVCNYTAGSVQHFNDAYLHIT